MTDSFEEDWTSLRTAVASGDLPSPKSEMWEAIIHDFTPRRDAGFLPGANRGYNFILQGDDRDGWARARLRLAYLAQAAARRLANRLWSVSLNAPGPDHLMAYPRFERALKLLGVGEDYLKTCGELGVVASHYNTAKLFHVSCVLEDGGGLGADSSVIEIGGGTGNLAVLLARRFGLRHYAIVDLPEMLLHAALTLRHFFPERPIRFAHRLDGPLPAEPGFLLVPHAQARRLPEACYDAALNIDSFQEMTREQVAGYLELVQLSVKDGGLFLNINRRKEVGDYDNNPLLYPYKPCNEVLRWETDPFLHHALNADRKDNHMLRLERVRRSGP